MAATVTGQRRSCGCHRETTTRSRSRHRVVVRGTPHHLGCPRRRPGVRGPSDDSAHRSVRSSVLAAIEYVLALGLSRVSTLTFELDLTDGQAKAEFRRFLRRLRKKVGRFPYLMVVEHGRRGRVHLHLAHRPDLDLDAVAACWLAGTAWVPRHPKPWWNEATAAAYVVKDFRPGRGRNYEPARGWMAEATTTKFGTTEEALAAAFGHAGPGANRAFDSAWCPSWSGPAVTVVASKLALEARRRVNARILGRLVLAGTVDPKAPPGTTGTARPAPTTRTAALVRDALDDERSRAMCRAPGGGVCPPQLGRAA